MPETGTVKYYNQAKGFGTITAQNGQDVFVHFTGVIGGIARILPRGAAVEFVRFETARGPYATEVVLLGAP